MLHIYFNGVVSLGCRKAIPDRVSGREASFAEIGGRTDIALKNQIGAVKG
ncbi:hypothetical protein SDC9_211779 [bioreactor metagenome]|uniref:Uncharacterized protein n=1 Tax=bioreactor metagenome TaxID=1076179 RepID=A0A645JLP0_9ZZZZ